MFGIPNYLSNPRLRLKLGSHTIYENDNWGLFSDQSALSSATSQVGAFGLQGNEAALVVELPAGIYTCELDGHGGNGIAIVEVYVVD